MKKYLAILMYIGFVFVGVVPAKAEPSDQYPFVDIQQQKKFQQLTKQIRCVVCQNQDIADSNAELAKDLRQHIYQFIQQGKSEDEILDYLTKRYGEFILFQPQLTKTTGLLWFAPFILLVLAVAGLLRHVRKREGIRQ